MGMFANRQSSPFDFPMPGIIGGYGGGTFDLDGRQVTPVQLGASGPMNGASMLQDAIGMPNPRPMQPADYGDAGPGIGSMIANAIAPKQGMTAGGGINPSSLGGPSNPGLGEMLMQAARPPVRDLTQTIPQFNLSDAPAPDPMKFDASPGLAGLNGFRAAKVRPHFFDKDGIGSKVLRGLGEFALQYSASSGDQGALMTLRNRFEEQNNQRRQQQQARQQQAERDEWIWRESYKREHPDDQFTQYLQAAGIDPRSQRGQELYQQRAENMAAPPMMAVDGFDAQGNQTKTFVPRTGYGMPSKAAPAGPKPGTVRNGYVFRGGNPNDRNSWVPAGGAPSNGGATFR